MNQSPPSYMESVDEDNKNYDSLQRKYDDLELKYNNLIEAAKNRDNFYDRTYLVLYTFGTGSWEHNSYDNTISCYIGKQILWQYKIEKLKTPNFKSIIEHIARSYPNTRLLCGSEEINGYGSYHQHECRLCYEEGSQTFVEDGSALKYAVISQRQQSGGNVSASTYRMHYK